MSRGLTSARSVAILSGTLAVFLCVLTPPAGAQSITIDSFATNQAALSLTFPPAGTTASSSASGGGILGSERDLQINLTAGVIAGNSLTGVVSSGFYSYSQDATIAGNSMLQWDGSDASPALNATGLGGIDLTVGGIQDAFLFDVEFDDLPVDVTIVVYSDAGNASSLTFTMPGLLFSSTPFVLPFNTFTTSLGAGADFTNVGAITLSVGSAVTAPDVVIDFLQTTSTLTASKTVAIQNDVDGDGNADPGDTLRYTIVLTNPDDASNASATGVTFTNPAPANTALVVGSVTTTQGSVTTGNTGGDTSVGVNVGTILDAGTVTITFDVIIDNPLPAGVTQITCQGLVDSDTLDNLPTDDPTQGGGTDPTIIPVTATPLICAPKTAALANDTNSDGLYGPGDTIQYTITITGCGNQDVSGVMFTNNAPLNTMLVVGSVTTTQGSITSGNTAGNTNVAVNVGTVAGNGGTVTVTFQVTINSPLPPNITQITCQGQVTGTNVPPTLTDDPGTPAPNDPTVVPVTPVVVVTEVPTLGEWGALILAMTLALLGLMWMRKGVAG
jgi:uncharacterized repeat protein (TIGR01451 family)